jgi:hypothetical protein
MDTIDKQLFVMMETAGGLRADPLHQARLDDLVDAGLALVEKPGPLLPGRPSPQPIYRITAMGRFALAAS